MSALAALAATVVASDVYRVSLDEFDEFINDNPLALVEFFAPWCGHCKSLAPEYEIAATALKEKNIPLVQIDCTVEDALCAQQQIQGYPTLKVFKGDAKKSVPYAGARSADAIISYMTKQGLPSVSQLTSAEFSEFVDSDDVVVIAHFGKKDSALNSTYNAIAEELRENFVFGAVEDESIAKEQGVQYPSIVVHKKFDDKIAVYDGDLADSAAIANFISLESMPLIGEVNANTFSNYAQSGIPLCYLFIDDEEDLVRITKWVEPRAKELKGKVFFAVLDAKLYGGHAENVNLKQEFPALVVQNFETDKKYVLDQSLEVTEKSIKAYLDSFVSGELEPTVKSEPIPETQGPVYTIVGKNYDDVVLNSKKDVLVEFYAPWCGHCKSLAPIYQELGEYFEDDDNVIIGQVDATANDIPERIPGYPTIKLYKANDKKNPVEYRGARNLEALIEFIEQNSKAEAEDEKTIDHDEL
ncbi:protein disulfide isomerase [Nadsonia fulvescens var. elongata DSM 6958]|uniref:Protein disulfide-isomerase n=1 Tax=Nadsonia fulvescens var. elongata DSM 6958 TaxID=857566 RepID=A0A1E3PQF1_9ASCO|nr:protein disulfide isomerase [Nadsonia fulvescens var. elongata DSM 6958]